MPQVVSGPAGFDVTQLDLTGLLEDEVLIRSASAYRLDLGADENLPGALDSAGSNYLSGGAGDDILIGGAGLDHVNGDGGRDSIDGGAGGDDWLFGGAGDDLVVAHAGNVTINGALGADTVAGGAGDDLVRGGQGDDIVNGGGGNDRLFGDRGADTITGGAGADIFHFSAAGGPDCITDFDGAEGDRIQLDPGAAYTLRQSGANAELVLSSGDTLTLIGVQSSSLAGWILA